MKFRFTPVLLFFFLSALIIVSAFLLWATYRIANEALEFEQLEQVEQTHELATQHLNYRLKESIRRLETLAIFGPTENGNMFSAKALNGSLWDYTVRFANPLNDEPVVLETYGHVTPSSITPLKRNNRWFYETTPRGISLVYQFQSSFTLADGNRGIQMFKGGIYLNENGPLISEMKEASRAETHHLIYENRVLAASESLEPGVQNAAQKVLNNFEPVFSDLETPFSADIRPLRIDQGPKGLYLVSVSLTEGIQSWRQNFNDTVVLSIQFVLLIAIIGTFLLRFLTRRSLNNLHEYAEKVRNGDEQVVYHPGRISEFNDVGDVITNVVNHLSEKGKYISDMVEAANSPVIAWDKDGTITLFNKAAEELFTPADGRKFLTISDFLKAQNNPSAHKAYEDALKGKVSNSLETKVQTNGNTAFVLWSIAPFFDINNTVSGAIAQGQNITDRRLAERRLRLSSKVFDSTAEAILITDDKGDIVDVNAAFTDITGYARSEVIGQNPRIMKSGRHSKEFYQNMWDSLAANGIWRGEIWDRRKNGEDFPKWLSISASRNESGRLTNYVAVFSDITGKKADEDKLEQLAHFDPLTGLPNRVLFQDRLYTALARAKRDKDLMALLFVDLDKFKQVNDSLGHRVGDMLLKEVSKRLLHSVREIDTVGRLSGDEFTVILSDIASQEDVEMVASRIVKSVGAPYFFEGHELFVSASVGIAIFPTDGDTSADLLRNADIAMYHAKEIGRNNYQFFNADMNQEARSQLSLANKLRIALNRKLIEPHYQLKVDCTTGKPIGLEALARWNDEHGKPISPAKFIPVAEEHGLIVRVGQAIVQQACIQVRMWQDMDFDCGSVAINLSAQQFRDRNLLNDIKTAMEDNLVSPERLEVEVTENMMMEDVEGAIQILNDIKAMGLKIAIDDFGTGYSSLNYLKKFPVDTLKIDRSFVYELTPNSDDAAIVSAIVSMAHELGIDVVAEGVEEKDQIDFLQSIGCTIMQGFYYAKPCPGGEIPLVWGEVLDKHCVES
jgi:diguanylate cyclase (GGDEF)-like protein/PAS domain S-box-containing protein